MNKKLLVAAVGAAVAMTVGAAQADVKVGGVVHMSLDNLDRDNSADKGKWFVSNNSSFFYIHADEDLGGGMKAVGHIELGFSPAGSASASVQTDTLETSNGTVSTSRDNYVGLSGGFGELTLGNRNSAIKDVGGIFDLFYREQLGEMRSMSNQSFFDTRIANAVHYSSPSMGGWTVKVQYGTEDDYATDFKGIYANVVGTVGPVKLGAAYGKQDVSAVTDTSGYRLAAAMDFGPVTVRGVYQKQTDVLGISGIDRSTYGLGAGFTMGKNLLKAQYLKANKQDGQSSENGASQMSIGWDYNLSKTAMVYATYAKTGNDAAGTFGLGGAGHGEVVSPAAGHDAKGFSLGVRKAF